MAEKATAMREWNTEDKSEWGAGPWQDEPDKVQWVDEETGFDCLIVRNGFGALCGYVGVPVSHPLHGVDYSGCPKGCGETWCEHSPEARFNVHGGLTFSDSCHEPTRAEYDALGERLDDPKLMAEAEKYPQGDAARRLNELRRQAGMSFDEWVEDQYGHCICHVPLPGRPDNVWWFGFDCAHGFDLTPHPRLRDSMPGETYRTRAYVEDEVRGLAAQLAEADHA